MYRLNIVSESKLSILKHLLSLRNILCHNNRFKIKVYVVSQQPAELQDRTKQAKTVKFRVTETAKMKSSAVVSFADKQITIKLKSWHDIKLYYDTKSS